MPMGEIKRLEREHGSGFIRSAGASEDVFFHSSALQRLLFDQLTEGQAVEFEKQPHELDPRRTRAINVRVPDRAVSTLHRIPII